jgi:EmrB/QacA subfamily drug resistance transporter
MDGRPPVTVGGEAGSGNGAAHQGVAPGAENATAAPIGGNGAASAALENGHHVEVDATAAARETTDGPVPAAPGAGGTLTHRQVLVVLVGLLLGMLLAALDQTIVATALPTIVGDLHGLNHLSWVVTAYLLTSTVSTPLYGKISDLYGRKNIFQAAIVIFLVGSILSGLSQNMGELIGFRALQGLGAGGLIALAMTIVADIVSPRERGRYQGYFGGVFALASVGGPLLGGFFVDQLSWRWIFYINVPIGIVALAVTSVVLKLPFARRPHAIDYTGASILVASVTALLLVTVWGGTTYRWSSGIIIGLIAAGLVLLVVFIFWEQRTPEPLLPLRLFRNSIFTVSNVLTFLMASLMFGATIYLPVYFQLVQGVSATRSGLLILPLVAGMVVTSVISGLLVTRLGRYKIFPLLGTAMMGIGMWLLTHLGAHTSFLVTSAYMAVAGLGMGLIMQVLTVAVQNAVDVRELGTATAALGFFRSMGAAFGTAILGAVLVSRLGYWLPRLVPAGSGVHISASASFTATPAAVRALPPDVRAGVVESFVHSLNTVFAVGVPIALAALILALFLKEIRLRDTSHFELLAEGEGVAPSAGPVPALAEPG